MLFRIFFAAHFLFIALILSQASMPHDASAEIFSMYLSEGDSGVRVSLLQHVLKDQGFFVYPDITGYYGPITEAAVEAFQKANGIVSENDPPGYAGLKTLDLVEALLFLKNETDSVRAAKGFVTPSLAMFTRDLYYGSKDQEVMTLQRFLNFRHYTVAVSGAGSEGNETAYFGPATLAALKEYQNYNKDKLATELGYFGPLSRELATKSILYSMLID